MVETESNLYWLYWLTLGLLLLYEVTSRQFINVLGQVIHGC